MSALPQTGERWRATCVVEGAVVRGSGWFDIGDHGWAFEDGEVTSPDGWTFEKVTPPLPTTLGSTVYCDRGDVWYFLTRQGWVDHHGHFAAHPLVDHPCIHDIHDAGTQR
jgi:hypothetical protein